MVSAEAIKAQSRCHDIDEMTPQNGDALFIDEFQEMRTEAHFNAFMIYLASSLLAKFGGRFRA